MNSVIKYGLIAAVIGGFYLYNNFNDSDTSYVEDDIDLNAVLDVTMDSLYAFDEGVAGQENLDADTTFLEFSEMLQEDYNRSEPSLYKTAIGVSPQTDASLMAFEDPNGNSMKDAGEEALFMIEIDGENSRIIASSRSGAVNDHHFSGTSLLTGYLIGSLLSRQKMSGMNTSNLSSKKPVSASNAARARAGSGSHSRGK